MPRWSAEKIRMARELRSTGQTLPEITAVLTSIFGRTSYGRIWDYIKDVPVLPEFQSFFNERRNSSARRSIKEWGEAKELSDALLVSPLTRREYFLVASMLYWAEGNKKDLCISNGSPLLLKTFKYALQAALNIPDDRFKLSLLLYPDLEKEECIEHWIKMLGLQRSQLVRIWIREGKEGGKLPHGIGILRLRQPGKELKILTTLASSVINLFEVKQAPIVQ